MCKHGPKATKERAWFSWGKKTTFSWQHNFMCLVCIFWNGMTIIIIIVRLMLVIESSISHNEKNINHNCMMSCIDCCHYHRGQESIKVHLLGHSHAYCSYSNMSILSSVSTWLARKYLWCDILWEHKRAVDLKVSRYFLFWETSCTPLRTVPTNSKVVFPWCVIMQEM